MRWLRILRLRVRSISRRASLERELEDELRFHLDHQVEQNIAAGMDVILGTDSPLAGLAIVNHLGLRAEVPFSEAICRTHAWYADTTFSESKTGRPIARGAHA